MLDRSQGSFVTTPLDANLLATPFSRQTNWYVFTGAACTGKTTLLEMMATKGFHTVPEGARLCFEEEMAKGRAIQEILRDVKAIQQRIAAKQLLFERDQPADSITFLDRAVPDSLSFYRVNGMDPNEILPECFHHRYAGVFLLDRLPLHRSTPLGPEDDISSDFLNDWLARDYSALGYRVVRVPALPPEERLAFVLERLILQRPLE